MGECTNIFSRRRNTTAFSRNEQHDAKVADLTGMKVRGGSVSPWWTLESTFGPLCCRRSWIGWQTSGRHQAKFNTLSIRKIQVLTSVAQIIDYRTRGTN